MIDLGVPRDLGEILSACWRLYRGHFAVFATIALAVVVPLDIIGTGLIEGRLHGGFVLDDATENGPASTVIQTLITVPLITGAHVTAVMQIADGEQPSAGRALSHAGGVFRLLIGTVILYSLGVLGGTALFILPGVWLAIRWYVATQAVVAEDQGPVEALRRSSTLVHGMWWRVFGIGIVVALIGGVFGVVAGIPVGVIAAAADSGPLLLVGRIVADAVILSFTALAGTLLFFDLRARERGAPAEPTYAPPPPPPPPPPPEAPERPIV